mmetsp:Transcript_53853/g.117866  ORF Transcript_53853/g.117866 Transcript_53853/m.117866 type:complete len:97 (-) Transcript_53853:851-1141(-)
MALWICESVDILSMLNVSWVWNVMKKVTRDVKPATSNRYTKFQAKIAIRERTSDEDPPGGKVEGAGKTRAPVVQEATAVKVKTSRAHQRTPNHQAF